MENTFAAMEVIVTGGRSWMNGGQKSLAGKVFSKRGLVDSVSSSDRHSSCALPHSGILSLAWSSL